MRRLVTCPTCLTDQHVYASKIVNHDFGTIRCQGSGTSVAGRHAISKPQASQIPQISEPKKYPKPIVTSTMWYYELACAECQITSAISANIAPGTKCTVHCPFCGVVFPGKVEGIGRFER